MKDTIDKKKYVKRNGYWVSKKFVEHPEPVKSMFCPKCKRANQHKDDRYLLQKGMCGDCWIEEEMLLLNKGVISEADVGKL